MPCAPGWALLSTRASRSRRPRHPSCLPSASPPPRLDYRYGGTKQTSEQFNTAGRSVKTGLIANVRRDGG